MCVCVCVCVCVYIYIYRDREKDKREMVITTEGFFEVALESGANWDLNPRPLNFVQPLLLTELSGHDICISWFTVTKRRSCRKQFHGTFSENELHKKTIIISSYL